MGVANQLLCGGVCGLCGVVLGYLVWGGDRGGHGGGAGGPGGLAVERGGEREGSGWRGFERGERDQMQGAVVSGEADVMGLLESRLELGLSSPTDLLGDVQALAEVAGAEDLQAMYERLGGGIGSPDYTAPIVENWARVDPEGAVAFFRNQRGYTKRHRLGRVHAVWSKRDPQGAMASALALDDPEVRKTSVENILSMTANDDGPEALRMWRALPSPVVNEEWLFEHVFLKWARDRPEEAAAEVAAMGSSALKREALEGVASGWAKDDPEGALVWAEGLGSTMRTTALARILPALAKEDAVRAWELAQTLPANYWTQGAVSEVAVAYYREAPEEGLAAVLALPPGRLRSDVLGGVVRQLVVDDPGAAAGLVTGGALDADERGSLTSVVAEVWAENDLAAAVAWADGLKDHQARRGALRQVAGVWAKSDPEEAMAYAGGLGDEGLRAQFFEEVFETWGDGEAPHEAMAAALGTEDADLRGRAVSALMRSWGRADPEGAAAFVDGVPVDEGRFGLERDLATNWAIGDAPAAAAWLRGRGDLDGHSDTMRSVVSYWKGQDLFGASQWTASLPRGAAKDAAVGELLEELRDDPEAMVLWIEEIEEPGLKESWLRRVPGVE